VRAEQLLLESSEGPVETDLRIPVGRVWTVEHDDPRWRSALVWTVAGWRKPDGGRLGVLGCVLPEESGAVRKKVRVVPASSRDEDELTVRQYLRSVLVAQSSSPWRPGDAVDQALDQSEAWLDPLTETDSRTQTRLEDRRLGALSAIERQLVALSAAATQAPELIVVQDADAGLGTVEMSWFSGVCHEIVGASDATVLLVGQRIAVESAETDEPVESREPEPAVVGTAAIDPTDGIPTDGAVDGEPAESVGSEGERS
jgi:ABC-type branched-subunit amino acid transport system ATPase component